MLRVVTVLVVLLALPSTAWAGTVSKVGTAIAWTAPAGEANVVTIAPGENTVTVAEPGVLAPAEMGCTQVDLNTATCPFAAGDTVTATADDMDDTITCVVTACALNGGAGNDTLVGGAGSQTFTGGEGTDTADYSARTDAVAVDTGVAGGDGAEGEADDVGGDVERVLGGPGNDTLSAAQVEGGEGDDVLTGAQVQGGGGNDRLVGRAGAQTLDGGAGTDTGDYSSAVDSIEISLDGVANDADGDDVDVEHVLGGGGNDVLVGDANANRLDGGAGDDRLDGGPGPDTIVGGDGEHDEATYANRTVAVDVTIGGGAVSGNAGDGPSGARDTLDVERVVGGSGGDRLTGVDGSHGFDGGPGDDVITARDGDTDSAFCGTGTDSAIIDPGDFVLDDCENVDRGATEPPPQTAPSPPPSPPPTPPAPPQTTPPPDPLPLAVAAVRGQTLTSFLAKGLRVRVTCPGPCRARLRILISRSTARKLGIDVEIARGSLRITAAERKTAVVKASARLKRRLKKSRRLKITIETRVTQTGAKPTTKRSRLTLRRSGGAAAGF